MENKHKGIKFYLREDMYQLYTDTINLIFTASTLPKYKGIFDSVDSVTRANGISLLDSLMPKSCFKITVYSKSRIVRKYLTVKYNFGFDRKDFFDEFRLPEQKYFFVSK